jgi:hypothetical protein
MYESGWEAISAVERLCFGAHRVLIGVRGSYVMFDWNYKATPIKAYRNQADRLCVSGIGSNFHLPDFGFGRLLRVSPLRSNFWRKRLHVYRDNSIWIHFVFFFWAGSILYSNTNLYTSFLYVLSKAQHPLYINMIYKCYGLKFIRLNPPKVEFKYLKPLYVEIKCMWFLANYLQLMCVSCVFLLLKHV